MASRMILHLLVWLKTPLESEGEKGDLSPVARASVDAFVTERFVRDVDDVMGSGQGSKRVLWFKNWLSLQSVRGVDHVHVLVKDVPNAVVRRWVGD